MESYEIIDVPSEPEVIYEDQEKPIPTNIYGDTPTLENTLDCLGLFDALNNLDKSLEAVKTNKIKKEDHVECSKSTDKLIQQLSLKHHPDRFHTGSEQQKARAHEMQSALNVTRTVLRTLTEEFLENIDIDYKYAYFAQLDVRSLVNRSEIDSQLKDVLFKICELSEIKRVYIIGEIRKFLVESRRCLNSYFQNSRDFIKYRDYALFHLKKCIGGYSELVNECEGLEKECKLEREENMRRIIHEMKTQISRELRILVALRYSAKDSVKSNFQIFNINQYMDEYFILPFVYYVNVLLMCNATVEKKKFLNFAFVDPFANPYFEMHPTLFGDAYHMAVNLYDGKQCVEAVERIMKEKYPNRNWERDEKQRIKIPDSLVRNNFNKVLEDIMKLLENKFRTEAYNEGKTNREKLNERLERLKKVMADLQEKEKCLRENISVRQKENQEIRKECEKIMVKNERVQKEMRKNAEHTEKPSERTLLKGEENTVENSGVSQNYNQGENLHKTIKQQITDLHSKLQQNPAENRAHLKEENAGKYDRAAEKVKENQEIRKECEKIMVKNERVQKEMRVNAEHTEKPSERTLLKGKENTVENSGVSQNYNQGNKTEIEEVQGENLHKTINQQITDLLSNLQQNSAENRAHLKEENAGKYDRAAEKVVEEILLKIKKSLKESKTIQKDLSSLLQNITEHSGMFGNHSQENFNKLQLILKHSDEMETTIQESRYLVKQLLNNYRS